jgi:hypothetical protein
MPPRTEPLVLSLLPGRFAVCRLHSEAALPAWAEGGAFCSATRTKEELSVVCEEEAVPEAVKAEKGWAALRLHGPIDLGTTGVLAALAAPLAAADLSIFAISTFDTDYLLVKGEAVEAALLSLRGAGHVVHTPKS